MRINGVVVVLSVVLGGAQTVRADGEVKVYKEQMNELHKKVAGLLASIDRPGVLADDRMHRDAFEQVLGLTKLIHRLEEGAEQADLDHMQRGEPSNETLLAIALGCEALDFELKAMDGFLYSSNRAFLQRAREGDALLQVVEKML